MKPDFESRKMFFKKPSPEERRPPMPAKTQVTEPKGTNTLTYSETVQEYQQKPSTDKNTVFKFTDQGSKVDDEEILADKDASLPQTNPSKGRLSVPGHITKSQHLAATEDAAKPSDNFSKSNFLDSKVKTKSDKQEPSNESQEVSQNAGEKEFREIFERKQKLIPEYNGVWFQFHTEAIYCNVTSLSLVRFGIVYDVPFAVAKIVLKSKASLVNFLHHCDLVTNIGTLIMDHTKLEEIKNSAVEDDQDFELDYVEVKGDRIWIEYPLARIWDRYSKTWSHKLLDMEEINSIDSQLTGLELVASL